MSEFVQISLERYEEFKTRPSVQEFEKLKAQVEELQRIHLIYMDFIKYPRVPYNLQELFEGYLRHNNLTLYKK